jgi:rubrerythrin
MCYSPGIKYNCPKCESDAIGFIIDEKFKEWLETMRLIAKKKINLSNSYKDYKEKPNSIKWMCYKCRDCGIVQKNK